MNSQFYRQARFLKSAATLKQLPADSGYEVALVGRSNVGKSSALNCLTEQAKLARISKTPGRTQLINVFQLDDERRLVDLPGYGYAKVSQAIKQAWQHSLSQYLQQRQCLRGLIVLIDIRHDLKALDHEVICWANSVDLPVHVVLTKADKLRHGAQKQAEFSLLNTLNAQGITVSCQRFSALNQQGLAELHAKLDEWYER